MTSKITNPTNKLIMKKTLGYLGIQTAILTVGVSTLFGQSNTPCNGGGAPTLAVNSTCVFTASTTVGATQQTTNANFGTPSCGSMGEDVWYQFTAPASGNVTITTQAGSITDGVMALYNDGCSVAYSELDCSDDVNGFMPEITNTTLTPGATYYIRFWDYGGGTGTFDICIQENAAASAPANDDCANAIGLTVNPDLNCGTTTSGSIENATGSPDPTSETCFGTADDDVWYSFVATSTAHTVSLINVAGSTTDLYHSVYEEGAGCPGLGAEIVCSDPDLSTLTGLTIGNTYFVRVYTWTATGGQTTTFDICVGTQPPPPAAPANDDCGNAIALTVNSDLNCGTVTSGTIESSTASPDPTNESCFGTADDDVWYTFVATSTDHTVSLINTAGSTTDMYHSVYEEGPGCPGLGTEIICNDADLSTLTGLTVGNTYYVRVYTWTSTGGQTSTFDICVGTQPPPPPPPTNDDCPDMEPICTSTGLTFTANAGGITDINVDQPGNNYDCLGTSPDPAWYYLEISQDGDVNMNLTAPSDIDFVIWGPFSDLTAAENACGNLGQAPTGTNGSVVDCSFSSTNNEFPDITGALAGEVYVMVITNYAGVVQTVSLTQVGGAGGTDCTIVTCPGADAGSW